MQLVLPPPSPPNPSHISTSHFRIRHIAQTYPRTLKCIQPGKEKENKNAERAKEKKRETRVYFTTQLRNAFIITKKEKKSSTPPHNK